MSKVRHIYVHDMESKPKPPDARYPVDEEWLRAQPATSFMSWAGFKRRLMEKLGIEHNKFYEWDVPSDWIAAWKRAGQKKFKDARPMLTDAELCPGSNKLTEPLESFRSGSSQRHAPNQTVQCPVCKTKFTFSARQSSRIPEHSMTTKDGRASFHSFIAWEAIVKRKGALITQQSADKGRETVYIARLPNAADEKIGEFRKSVFDPNAAIGWIEYKAAEDARLTLSSIAAAAKAQMPDVARLELVRGNGYFYVVGEWKKKRKGQPIPITSGGIYTNRLGEDGEKFGMSFWVAEVKRVVEEERPHDWDDIP